jgi:hypothetical protein
MIKRFFGSRFIAVLPLTYPDDIAAIRSPEISQVIGATKKAKAIARGVISLPYSHNRKSIQATQECKPMF